MSYAPTALVTLVGSPALAVIVWTPIPIWSSRMWYMSSCKAMIPGRMRSPLRATPHHQNLWESPLWIETNPSKVTGNSSATIQYAPSSNWKVSTASQHKQGTELWHQKLPLHLSPSSNKESITWHTTEATLYTTPYAQSASHGEPVQLYPTNCPTENTHPTKDPIPLTPQAWVQKESAGPKSPTDPHIPSEHPIPPCIYTKTRSPGARLHQGPNTKSMQQWEVQ